MWERVSGRSLLKWAGHVEQMEGEQLMNRCTHTVEGRRRRGRPRLRWEDCMKRGLEGVGEDWRMSARDRRSGNSWWRRQ